MSVGETAAGPASSGAEGGRRPGMSLRTRVYLVNAAVLAAAVLVLALSPVTVSRPLSLGEAVVLVAGLTALLIVDLVLFRHAFAPLDRLTRAMRTADPLQRSPRIPIYGADVEVAELTEAFNEMLERLQRERRHSARRSLGAQEGERLRVAQELHDEVGQSLTAVVLQIDRVSRSAPESVREELIQAREGARESLEEIRQIAQRLRPEALDELGLPSALAALAERVSDQSELEVTQMIEGDLPKLSPELELVIYRVAQESLTNVLRHSGAFQAVLSLRSDAEGLSLQVSDDGRGLDGFEPGAGIQGMRERALLVGGALEIGARGEGGVEVRLQLPREASE